MGSSGVVTLAAARHRSGAHMSSSTIAVQISLFIRSASFFVLPSFYHSNYEYSINLRHYTPPCAYGSQVIKVKGFF